MGKMKALAAEDEWQRTQPSYKLVVTCFIRCDGEASEESETETFEYRSLAEAQAAQQMLLWITEWNGGDPIVQSELEAA